MINTHMFVCCYLLFNFLLYIITKQTDIMRLIINNILITVSDVAVITIVTQVYNMYYLHTIIIILTSTEFKSCGNSCGSRG